MLSQPESCGSGRQSAQARTEWEHSGESRNSGESAPRPAPASGYTVSRAGGSSEERQPTVLSQGQNGSSGSEAKTTFVIFLNVHSAFHVKRSGHCVCCSAMKNGLAGGFLHDQHGCVGRAEQGAWVSAPPTPILNQDVRIVQSRGTAPESRRHCSGRTARKQRGKMQTRDLWLRDASPFVKASGLLGSLPYTGRGEVRGGQRRRRRRTGGRDADCPGGSGLNGW